MNRPLQYLCLVLVVASIGLLIAAARWDFGNVMISDDPASIIGVAVALIGGLTARRFKQKQQAG